MLLTPQGQTAPPSYVPIRGDKWRPEEDAKLMELLTEKGMNWKDISKELLGRSEKSCSQRYYQFLSKRLLNDPKTEKIIGLYMRERARMWEPIAKEVALPWHTVESIYLQVQRAQPAFLEENKRKWKSFNPQTREDFTTQRQASSGLHRAERGVSQLQPRHQITIILDSNRIHKRRQQRPAFQNRIERAEPSDDEYHTADDRP